MALEALAKLVALQNDYRRLHGETLTAVALALRELRNVSEARIRLLELAVARVISAHSHTLKEVTAEIAQHANATSIVNIDDYRRRGHKTGR